VWILQSDGDERHAGRGRHPCVELHGWSGPGFRLEPRGLRVVARRPRPVVSFA
jgi:hypothetical protein